MFASRVKAVLGPTNTGKTHLAITRMLGHASGIIGFPLRLLARENYDRMVAAKGARYVGLITGEEKIVPPEAKWFACTVEAMPLDRRTEFLAIDEVQLCADPDRGHIFTDRVLHARGLVETMFLGAETIRPLLQRLVPQIEIETRPRLSQLTYAGPAKLTRLPPRSAVVAFSAGEVYAIAEAIRRRRGGCAVVMGRLSPRTRNAQVALYQNREVDFLVATDAIGMGLNMDVDHVAFAALQKFDGHRPRPLTTQEAAQIAGRAGRGLRDGTFGTTAECPGLDEDLVHGIEAHRFEPLVAIAWRNSNLDFSSIDALLDSLAALPPQAGLAKGNDATDHITLNALARDEAVRSMAGGRSRVKLLWETCQIPDFRKLADDSHTRFCQRVFTHLVEDGALPEDWIASQIATTHRTDGDIDTLMARLSAIRVWAYVAARGDWLRDADRFQNEARAAEDAVSDALHERLTARFVDRRAAHLIRALDDTEEELLSAVTRQGEIVVEGHSVGKIEGFVFTPDPSAVEADDKKLVLRAARRALREEMPRRVGMLEAGKDEDFALTNLHRILWEGHEVARLKLGPEPIKPQVEPLPSEFLDGPARERVRVRLQAWLDGVIARDFAPLFNVEAKAAEDAALRGPVFTLREHLGLLPGGTDPRMSQDDRAKLKAIGVRAGRFALYVPEMLKPRAMAMRAQIWALHAQQKVPSLPGGGLVSTSPGLDWPRGFGAAMGWMPMGAAALRLDVAERIAGELGHMTRRGPAVLPPEIVSRMGVKADALAGVLAALGFAQVPAEALPEGAFGPPTPPLVGPRPRGHEGQPRRRGGERPQQNRAPRSEGEAEPAETSAPTAEGAPAAAPASRPPRRDGPRQDRRDRPRGPRPAEAQPPTEGQQAPPAREARPAPGREGSTREGGNRGAGAAPRRDGPPREGQRPWQPRGPEGARGGARGGDRAPRSQVLFEPKPSGGRGPDPDNPFSVLANLLRKP
ncbi:ATP-dependent RNA helicase SUPV3L1/SUV3 [Humitalea rosea]|uniref:ATP-dependent RNA helicase SUPV3L1/SUV3 n=2 Tax=Humitalea rosea TaxID=990373 RepID=A0A2W7JTZ7_9PROT|nr:ATP-dependent RNA helicase SUPV3L1/SUV3 [Humitalea rosea]